MLKTLLESLERWPKVYPLGSQDARSRPTYCRNRQTDNGFGFAPWIYPYRHTPYSANRALREGKWKSGNSKGNCRVFFFSATICYYFMTAIYCVYTHIASVIYSKPNAQGWSQESHSSIVSLQIWKKAVSRGQFWRCIQRRHDASNLHTCHKGGAMSGYCDEYHREAGDQRRGRDRQRWAC